jgi:hypothetical protein
MPLGLALIGLSVLPVVWWGTDLLYTPWIGFPPRTAPRWPSARGEHPPAWAPPHRQDPLDPPAHSSTGWYAEGRRTGKDYPVEQPQILRIIFGVIGSFILRGTCSAPRK